MTQAHTGATGTNAIAGIAVLLIQNMAVPMRIAHTIITVVATTSITGTITTIVMIAAINVKARGTSVTAITTAAGNSR